MRESSRDRGAAAVEFALVVPILIALVLAIAVFGRAYQVQSSLSMAAREGARVMALEEDAGLAQSRAIGAAANLGVPGAVSVSASACSGSPASTIVIVSHSFDFLGVTIPMTGKGVMRCGG